MRRNILAILLCISLILSGYLGLLRIFSENQNKNVEMCIDNEEIRKLCALSGLNTEVMLEKLKNAGFTSVAVIEETPAASISMLFLPGYKLSQLKSTLIKYGIKTIPASTYTNYLISDDVLSITRAEKELNNIYFGLGLIKRINANILAINVYADELKEAGIGVNEKSCKYLSGKGFHVIPRLRNNRRFRAPYSYSTQPSKSSIKNNIADKFKMLSILPGIDMVIFDKKEVLGYPDNLPQTVLALKTNNLSFGFLEATLQDGGDYLAKNMGSRIVRVHSIPQDEIEEMHITPDQALIRYARGIKERNVRLIYVHPFFDIPNGRTALEYNLDYFSRLKEAIVKNGFSVGLASGPKGVQVSGGQVLILSLGVLVGLILLIGIFYSLKDWMVYALLAIGLAASAAMLLLGSLAFSQKIWALAAAIIFPAWAVLSEVSREEYIKPKKGYPYVDIALIILNITANTMIGALLIIGLLADSSFMLGANVFTGVKIALVAPMLIIAYFLFFHQGEEGTLKGKIARIWNMSLSIKTITYVFIGLVLLAVLLARSGNFTIPVPGFEKLARQFLEQVMIVRPRTKEFLIGYPALFLGLYYYLTNRGQRFSWLLIIIGSIAMISALNSFCHVHTPLILSLVRGINGLVLGLAFGGLLTFVSKRLIK